MNCFFQEGWRGTEQYFYPRHEQNTEGLMQFCQWQHVKLYLFKKLYLISTAWYRTAWLDSL